ncbi:MAG TPA: HTTM domain-containing protein [Chitinophagales bacterium]|nr:HTTM domain-containing protein [Chitinophagales bacterium]
MFSAKSKFTSALFSQTDGSGLAFFRISFGFIMLWEVLRYFGKDWIQKYYIKPQFHFTYEWFPWVQPLPGDGMVYLFYLLGLLAIMIAAGFLYRAAAAAFFIVFTYVFLLEQARYLNHFYLVSLVSFLLIWIPAHRVFSVDSWRKKRTSPSKKRAVKNLSGKIPAETNRQTVPVWSLLLLRFQFGAVYFFGALAKVNGDWLRGEPMRHWLADETDFPLAGSLFTHEWMIYFVSYSGILIDLLAPLLLLFRQTRFFMFLILLAFHLTNDTIFKIGIFPYFMMLASTIFFPADWLRQMAALFHPRSAGKAAFIIAAGFAVAMATSSLRENPEVIPIAVSFVAGGILAWTFLDLRNSAVGKKTTVKPALQPEVKLSTPHYICMAAMALWAAVQIALPLRHYFIPGNVSWTEEGHRFAWHMKLRNKEGKIIFYAVEPSTGEKFPIEHTKILKSWQRSKMSTRPYMIQQFAKYAGVQLRKQYNKDYEIKVDSRVSLNYRPYETMIEPDADLSKVTYSDFRHNNWITLPELPPVNSISLNPEETKNEVSEE